MAINYILKNIPEGFWKEVKMMALNQDVTVKALIMSNLERDVDLFRFTEHANMQTGNVWREFRKLCLDEGETVNNMLLELIAEAVDRARNRKEQK